MDITVCIPTYNRVSYLSELLESVRANAIEFDVLVLDNASTDGTPEFIRALMLNDARVRYERQPRNIGAVANLLDVVSRAQSEWVLLMSDDDIITKPLSFLQSIEADGVDTILLGRCDGDARVNRLRDWPYLDNSNRNKSSCLFRELRQLFLSGLCLGAAFTLISGILVRRSAWLRSQTQLMESDKKNAFSASLFPQSWIACNLMTSGSAVLVVDEPIVMARHGNDRLCDNDVLARAIIDITEFEVLASCLVERDAEAAEALRGLMMRHVQRHVFPRAAAAIYQRAKYGPTKWRDFCKLARPYLTVSQRLLPVLIPMALLDRLYRCYRQLFR